MTKLRFAQNVFLHLSNRIENIYDNSNEAKAFDIVHERALRVFVQDSRGEEFKTPIVLDRFKTKQDADNPYKPSGSDSLYAIYHRPESLIDFGDEIIPLQFSDFNNGFRSRGVNYFPVYLRETKNLPAGNYIISQQENNLAITAYLYKDPFTALWSPKALECAILYCAYLLASEFQVDERKRTALLREYDMKLGEYKIYTNSGTIRENNVPTAYDPIEIAGSNLNIVDRSNVPILER